MEKDKRYLVFVLPYYDEKGGMFDMEESFSDLEKAISYAKGRKGYHCDSEIYDRIEGIKIDWEDKNIHGMKVFKVGDHVIVSRGV